MNYTLFPIAAGGRGSDTLSDVNDHVTRSVKPATNRPSFRGRVSDWASDPGVGHGLAHQLAVERFESRARNPDLA